MSGLAAGWKGDKTGRPDPADIRSLRLSREQRMDSGESDSS